MQEKAQKRNKATLKARRFSAEYIKGRKMPFKCYTDTFGGERCLQNVIKKQQKATKYKIQGGHISEKLNSLSFP